MKKILPTFLFNEAKGKSGIRRNTNWMIFAVFVFIVISTFCHYSYSAAIKQQAEQRNTRKTV